MRLLIVEDDADVRQVLTDLLRQSGYEVDSFADGRDAMEKLTTDHYDLGIVDLGLPGMSGLDLVRMLRSRGSNVPILIITARDALSDRVTGLDSGADDYLVKPFDLPELQARVRALLRRHGTLQGSELRIGPLTMRMGEPRVKLGELTADLPAGEFALLEALALRVGHVVSRARIAARLTRGSEPPSDTAIEICVHRLRRRLEPHGLKVRTLRGFGYVLEAVPEQT
jgi:DNA-binding response OmpR family regulator